MITYPDSKVHGANIGPIWGRQDPGGPYVGPKNFVIWVYYWFISDPFHSKPIEPPITKILQVQITN